MAFPTKALTDTTWATDGGATTIPPAGLQATGWQINVVPGPNFQNYLHFAADEWIAYHDAAIEYSESFAPVITDTDTADFTARRAWVKAWPGASVWQVFFRFELAWNNTIGGIAGNDVQIELPFRPLPAGAAIGGAPYGSTGLVDLVSSTWTAKATDKALRTKVVAGADFAVVERILTNNTSPGNLLIDTGVARSVGGEVQYLSNGVYLL